MGKKMDPSPTARSVVPSSIPVIFDSVEGSGDFQLPQQPRRINVIRAFVFVVLALVAGLLGGYAYVLLRAHEIDTFDSQYRDAVAQLQQQLVAVISAKVTQVEATAAAFKFPRGGGAIHPSFEARGIPEYSSRFLKSYGGRFAALVPLVYPEERASFESWIGNNYQALNTSTYFPRLTPAQRVTLSQKFTRPITDGIFANGGSFPVADADALPSLPGVPAFFAPFLQRAPYFQTEVNDRFMMNNMNISSRAKTLLEVVQHKETASEGFIGYQNGTHSDPRRITLAATIISPGFATDVSTVTSFAFYTFNWLEILANSIPSYAALDLVLWCPEKAPTLFFPVPPPPNVSFAMRIERNVSINMGFGPATPRADTWLERRYETSFTIFLGRTRVVISARTIILPRVTPVQSFYDRYSTSTPINTLVACVLLVFGVSLVFVAYDLLARRFLRSVIIASVQEHAFKAERLEALRSNHAFASVMNHEIGSPALAIVGGLDVLSSTPLSKEQRNIVSLISGGAEQILALAEDALAAHPGGAGTRYRLHPAPVDLRQDIVNYSWLSMRLHSRYSEKIALLQLQIRISENVPARATLDAAHARVVIRNLIGTAVENVPTGGKLELSADFLAGANLLRIFVRDNGPPLTAAEYRILFKPFIQVEQRRFGKAAKGLMVSRDVAHAMAGDLTVENVPAPGTGIQYTATFRLEECETGLETGLVDGADAIEAWGSPSTVGGGGRTSVKGILKSKYAFTLDDQMLGPVERRREDGTRGSESLSSPVRVLVAEDDALAGRAHRVSFTLAGMLCDVVTDGLALTERVTIDPGFDLIVLDDKMARPEGYPRTASAQLHRDHSELTGGGDSDGLPTLVRLQIQYYEMGRQMPPVVALVSGEASEEVRALILSSGASVVHSKPLTVEAAEGLLRLAVDSRPGGRLAGLHRPAATLLALRAARGTASSSSWGGGSASRSASVISSAAAAGGTSSSVALLCAGSLSAHASLSTSQDLVVAANGALPRAYNTPPALASKSSSLQDMGRMGDALLGVKEEEGEEEEKLSRQEMKNSISSIR